METPQFAPRRIILRFRHGTPHEACRQVSLKYGHPIVRDWWNDDFSPSMVVLVPDGQESYWVTQYPILDKEFVIIASRERLAES